MKTSISILFFIIIGLIACSSSETSTDNAKNSNEFYVFDDVKNVDSLKLESDSLKNRIESNSISQNVIAETDTVQEIKSVQKFIVQLGAFSTKERAERFLSENKLKIKFKMSISFNKETNLYVVQIPPLLDRESAESVRNNLWQIPSFKDAFIITEEE